jgi:hypothetical protein
MSKSKFRFLILALILTMVSAGPVANSTENKVSENAVQSDSQGCFHPLKIDNTIAFSRTGQLGAKYYMDKSVLEINYSGMASKVNVTIYSQYTVDHLTGPKLTSIKIFKTIVTGNKPQGSTIKVKIADPKYKLKFVDIRVTNKKEVKPFDKTQTYTVEPSTCELYFYNVQ